MSDYVELPNYVELTKINIPATRQSAFNKSLAKIANKQPANLKKILSLGKCSEPLPSKMTLLPKDHKEIIKGRPLVSATDTPATTLSKILTKCLKPTLSLINSHLKDTANFIKNITEFSLADRDAEGIF